MKSPGLFSIITGVGISTLGYYTPFMIGGAMLMAIGAGLFLTFHVNTTLPFWYVKVLMQCFYSY
jgi:hypothetical protein